MSGDRTVLRAPAKLNLGLYVGERREDGLHELRSLFCPLELADRIVVSMAEEGPDEVVCELVAGVNLVARAIAELRAAGWEGPPLRVEIDKRIPVAAGLGGGSADAAAVLRWAAAAHRTSLAPPSGVGSGTFDVGEIAMRLGADVPSQVAPAFSYVAGAGERFERLADPAAFGCVLIPNAAGLSTAAVYGRFDELGLGRPREELDELGERLRSAASAGASPLAYAELLHNDLERAAADLLPEISVALSALREAGAQAVFVSGSGPTAVGLFEDLVAADAAASVLPHAFAGAIVSGSGGLVS